MDDITDVGDEESDDSSPEQGPDDDADPEDTADSEDTADREDTADPDDTADPEFDAEVSYLHRRGRTRERPQLPRQRRQRMAPRRRGPTNKRAWTEEENAVITVHFGAFICRHQVPGKVECVAAI